jgi:hypothetical protein
MVETTTEVKPPPREAAASSMHTLWLLAIFYAIAIVWGVRSVYQSEPSVLDFLVPLANAICLGAWAIVDARRRKHPIPMSAQPWFVFLAIVLVPAYVVWSRGWRGLAWLLLHVMLWFLVATISLYLGGWMIFGDAWLRALGLQ